MGEHDVSILVGGITGDGVVEAGTAISRLFNRLGYHVYMYNDYPSVVKGGHNFAMIRASDQKIGACSDQVDAILALSQDTIELHRARWKQETVIIYDQDRVQLPALPQPSLGLPCAAILKQEGGLPAMRNSCLIGGLCKMLGIDWRVYKALLSKHAPQMLEQNLKIGRRGYDAGKRQGRVAKLDRHSLPVVSGCHAISLGLLKAGLQAYVAYPMTPTSPILEFLAAAAQDFGLQVIPPESEIAVMLMALGYAYMGVKTAVGTSGGGFSLMVESLGLAGQAELPVVVVMGQKGRAFDGDAHLYLPDRPALCPQRQPGRVPQVDRGAGRCRRGLLLGGSGPEQGLAVSGSGIRPH